VDRVSRVRAVPLVLWLALLVAILAVALAYGPMFLAP
jgi:fatty acid desaturase